PARRRFEEIRAEAAAAADANPGLHAPRVDWVSLNQMLGDDEATLAWFDAVKADPLSELVFEAVEDRLIDIFKRRDRAADVGRVYSDPLANIEPLQRIRE